MFFPPGAVVVDCNEIKLAESQFDSCPDCCAVCHAQRRLWCIVWRSETRMVCCTIVAFALRHGARIDDDEAPPPH